MQVAKSAGFCFGVQRAVEMVYRLLEEEKRPIETLGPIIHNPQIVSSLEERGVRMIGEEDISEKLLGSVLCLRSHGVEKQCVSRLEELGIDYVDLTCPFVEKIHSIVARADEEGKLIFIIGDERHPEVAGSKSYGREVFVFQEELELRAFTQSHPEFRERPGILVAQTTQKKDIWKNCVQFVKNNYTNFLIFDTICYTTSERQEEAMRLSARSDVMLVLGGKNSANTRNLYGLCAKSCPRTYHIECAEELSAISFERDFYVGITAGASTPSIVIEEVVKTMSDLNKELTENTEAQEAAGASGEELNFAEEFEKSFKTLNTGDRVKAVVAAVYPNEIQVDLGTKQAGYVAFSEFTDDPSAKLEDLVKPGDEIDLVVTRVNDVEGMISLSKRRVDAMKSWDDIEEAAGTETVFTGKVNEAVKGGLVVNTKGVRIFIPASQVSGNRNAPLEDMVGKEVRFRILETDRRRRRAIGSIRALVKAERAEAEEKFFETAEVGKKYTGTVKSLTSYGAFVDLGGIDGMIHITELSWSRIKHPSEVVKVGDTVEVIINDIDREKKRISLGYKSLQPNPWDVFVASHKVGDVVNVKVVKMMPFGAFAEILQGVDGLIHISQIADHRIAKPQDVLEVNQQVDVKITDIDLENKKVSLSIRALLEPASEAEGENE